MLYFLFFFDKYFSIKTLEQRIIFNFPDNPSFSPSDSCKNTELKNCCSITKTALEKAKQAQLESNKEILSLLEDSYPHKYPYIAFKNIPPEKKASTNENWKQFLLNASAYPLDLKILKNIPKLEKEVLILSRLGHLLTKTGIKSPEHEEEYSILLKEYFRLTADDISLKEIKEQIIKNTHIPESLIKKFPDIKEVEWQIANMRTGRIEAGTYFEIVDTIPNGFSIMNTEKTGGLNQQGVSIPEDIKNQFHSIENISLDLSPPIPVLSSTGLIEVKNSFRGLDRGIEKRTIESENPFDFLKKFENGAVNISLKDFKEESGPDKFYSLTFDIEGYIPEEFYFSKDYRETKVTTRKSGKFLHHKSSMKVFIHPNKKSKATKIKIEMLNELRDYNLSEEYISLPETSE